MKKARLILADGSVFEGESFGFNKATSGEVVFNTAMTGYVESLTDPSYAGQLMVMTYPLVGNYGVPSQEEEGEMKRYMESDHIYPRALIVGEYSDSYSHWNAVESLSQWLMREQIPAITGIDTRRLTKVLREYGVLMGRIEIEGCEANMEEERYEGVNFVEQVSCKEVIRYNEGAKHRVVLVDYGVKNNIIRCLTSRNIEVIRVPWNYDFTNLEYDGLFLSNGPGDPNTCVESVRILQKFLNQQEVKPCMGICMGHQLLAKASGADIYKLKYGHRSHNQPVRMVGTDRCFVTSQNHGYCVDDKTIGEDWEVFFSNMNDGSNEGLRHKSRPWLSVQFHPEACGGPVDTEFLFDQFTDLLNH